MKSNNFNFYAKAMYELAVENKSINQFYLLYKSLIDVIDDNKKIVPYLSSSNVSQKNKLQLIKTLSNKNIYFENFLNILIDNRRISSLREYLVAYVKYHNNKNNIAEGLILTTEKVSKDTVDKIASLISKKIDKKVILWNKIDNQLIGGIRLEIGDNVWDNSIKGRLNNLKNIKEL